MKYSIITPVFNSHHLMASYFKSLENQSLKDFEVIIIDDCSTDSSYRKLSSYKHNSNLNIVLLKNEKNYGPGKSRNVGLSKAKGEYVTFIDSDDYVARSFLQEIDDVIREQAADCVIFDYYKKKASKITYSSSVSNFKGEFLVTEDALVYATGSTCCKVYKTETIKSNGIVFPDLMRFEDMVFNKLALSCSNNIYYHKKALYYYVMNKDSIVHDPKYRDEKYAIEAFKVLESKLSNKYPKEVEAIFARDMLYSAVLIHISKKSTKRDIVNFIEAWENKYPIWNRNSYIDNLSLHQRIALQMIKNRDIFGLKVMSYIREKRK